MIGEIVIVSTIYLFYFRDKPSILLKILTNFIVGNFIDNCYKEVIEWI